MLLPAYHRIPDRLLHYYTILHPRSTILETIDKINSHITMYIHTIQNDWQNHGPKSSTRSIYLGSRHNGAYKQPLIFSRANKWCYVYIMRSKLLYQYNTMVSINNKNKRHHASCIMHPFHSIPFHSIPHAFMHSCLPSVYVCMYVCSTPKVECSKYALCYRTILAQRLMVLM